MLCDGIYRYFKGKKHNTVAISLAFATLMLSDSTWGNNNRQQLILIRIGIELSTELFPLQRNVSYWGSKTRRYRILKLMTFLFNQSTVFANFHCFSELEDISQPNQTILYLITNLHQFPRTFTVQSRHHQDFFINCWLKIIHQYI